MMGMNKLRFGMRSIKVVGVKPSIMNYWSNIFYSDKFRTAGTVKADIPERASQSIELGFKHLEFDVELVFGKTEVEARIKWEEGVRYVFSAFHLNLLIVRSRGRRNSKSNHYPVK